MHITHTQARGHTESSAGKGRPSSQLEADPTALSRVCLALDTPQLPRAGAQPRGERGTGKGQMRGGTERGPGTTYAGISLVSPLASKETGP